MSWDNYNLPAIQAMLAAENTCVGADAVLEWDGLASAVDEQLRRLKKVQRDLAEVWPPEKNESAKSFLQKIGVLATSMEATMQSAANTRVGLNGIMDAINEAGSRSTIWREGGRK